MKCEKLMVGCLLGISFTLNVYLFNLHTVHCADNGQTMLLLSQRQFHRATRESVIGFNTPSANATQAESCFGTVGLFDHKLIVLVMAVVPRPCLERTLEHLKLFYKPAQIHIYHSSSDVCLRHYDCRHIRRNPPQGKYLHPRISISEKKSTMKYLKWRSTLVYDYISALRSLENVSAEKILIVEDDALHNFDVTGAHPPLLLFSRGKRICTALPTKSRPIDDRSISAVSLLLPAGDLHDLSLYLESLWDLMPVDWLIVDYYKAKKKGIGGQSLEMFDCSPVVHQNCTSTKQNVKLL